MAKTSVRFKMQEGLLRADIERLFDKVIDNKRLLKNAAEFAADRMRANARARLDVNNSNFQALSPKTVKQRKELQKSNQTGDLYSPARSNLTFSGQLLDSIKPIEISKGRFTVGPTGNRRSYVGKSGKPIKQSLEGSRNDLLGKIHNTGDGVPKRQFIGIDIQGQKTILEKFRRALRRAVREFNKKQKSGNGA